jgi:hypothetical protein
MGDKVTGQYGCAMTIVPQRIASLQGRPGVVARGAGRHTGLPLPAMPDLQVDMREDDRAHSCISAGGLQ